ncbi:MAG: hypothetical protein LBT89_02670, partial [Planctomycetaceae bacterium]|nr:hypothetical protein [Planctomycetaceae bacterium]
RRERAEERAEREAADEKRWAEAEKQRLERKADDEKRWAEAEKQRKELNQQIGGIGKSMGQHAEDFFYKRLARTLSLGGMTIEKSTRNLKPSRGNVQDEFDFVLHNGIGIVLGEVKYKFRRVDLKKLIKRKMRNFRILCPEYSDKNIFLAIAGLSFEDGVNAEARELGIAVLQKDGKNVEYDDSDMKAF